MTKTKYVNDLQKIQNLDLSINDLLGAVCLKLDKINKDYNKNIKIDNKTFKIQINIEV